MDGATVHANSLERAAQRSERRKRAFRIDRDARKPGENPMKFMLMMHTPRGTGDYAIFKWKHEEIKAHIDFMKNLNRDLRADGVRVGAEGLSPPVEARIVRAGKGNAPEVTD